MPDQEIAPPRWYRTFWWLPVGVVTVVVGVWGFANLYPDPRRLGPPEPPLMPIQVAYSTARLFTLNLDLPPGMLAPWWLYIAAVAAPLLTLRGIAELFRRQITELVVQVGIRPELVIVGANSRARALIAASSWRSRWRCPVVVVDPDPKALATITAPGVWKVVGDAQSPASLRRCAVHHATNTVVVTGDNARNSLVASAVLDLERHPSRRLYVEVEEPGLARTLEQGGQRAGVETTTFSAAALAAGRVLDEAQHAPGDPLLDAGPGGAPAVIALFGTGALVDAVILELHRRRRVQMLDQTGRNQVPPRILLFGPDAVARTAALGTLLGTELQALDLDPITVELDQVVELGADTARHLDRNKPLRRVLVVAPTDLDGGGIAISLARRLGRDARVTLVVESAASAFGDEIAEQTRDSATLARVDVVRAPEIAYALDVLAGERIVERLARGLYEVRNPAGPPWSQVDHGPYVVEAESTTAIGLSTEGTGTARTLREALRRTALVSLDRPELAPLQALGVERPTALARAGLGVDFGSLAALVPAGRTLLRRDEPAAFGVWAEIARLRRDASGLAGDLRDVDGRRVPQVRALVLLRRAALGEPDARLELAGRGHGGHRAATTVVLLAGSADRDATALLAPSVSYLPDKLEIRATRVAGDRAGEHVAVRTPSEPGDDPLDEALALWAGVLADGLQPADVRVLALPDTPPDELVLARALGARVGRVESPEAVDLNQTALGGAADILPLPDDPMTVRAFLRPGRWPAEHMHVRESLARELHAGYVTRQRDHTAPGDPVLRSWPQLSTWLRESNLAVVDDIPTKLAAIGLQLDGRPPGPPDPALVEAFETHIELLAEMEHGRFTAERLLGGWTSGVRNPARFVSPHLRSWTELSDDAKEIDRAVMRDVPPLLAHFGLGVRPIAG